MRRCPECGGNSCSLCEWTGWVPEAVFKKYLDDRQTEFESRKAEREQRLRDNEARRKADAAAVAAAVAKAKRIEAHNAELRRASQIREVEREKARQKEEKAVQSQTLMSLSIILYSVSACLVLVIVGKMWRNAQMGIGTKFPTLPGITKLEDFLILIAIVGFFVGYCCQVNADDN